MIPIRPDRLPPRPVTRVRDYPDRLVERGFVGRVGELHELSGVLDEAIAGRGQLVVIAGEGGVGKTRLCAEFASLAEVRGVGVARAACWETGGLPPFWPWWQLLDQLGADIGPAWAAGSSPELARAHLFASAIGAIRAASMSRPRLLVLDDVHWADAGTLRLANQVATVIPTLAAMLIATVRDTPASSLSRKARLVQLGGLPPDELGELVEHLTGSRPRAAVRSALHHATAGNPLFAGELVRRLHREDRLDQLTDAHDLPVSPTVRAVLDERLAELGGGCREVLAVAAAVGREFSLPLLAAATDRAAAEVLAAIDEAVRGGVVVPLAAGHYGFTHPLLRSVVYDDLGIVRRVRIHERIGDALELDAARGAELNLAALSFHYLNAAPGGSAGKAVRYAEQAGRAAMDALGYEDAARLYERALAADELDPTVSDRGTLLLGLGEARAASGDSAGARTAFLAAAAHARRSGDFGVLAAAALGMSGSGFEVTLFDHEQIGLLELALEARSDDAGLRSRLCARLSVALSLAGQDERRAALADAAVVLAHDAADPAALGPALAARCDARAGPADIAERATDSAALIRLARERGDHAAELLGRRLRLVAALEAGDVHTFDAEVHAFAQVANWLRQPQYQWYVPLWQAMRAAMRGRLADQQVLSRQAEELGRAAGSVNVDILMMAHKWFVWLETGDVSSLLEQVDTLMPPGAYTEMGPQMLPAFVMNRYLAGREDEARAVLDAGAEDLRAAARDSEWLTMVAQVADACFRLGGHELVPWLYDALAPFADRWSVDGIGAYAHGPVHRQLGVLAVLLERPARASAHFDAALSGNRRAGADLLVARTLRDRGVALDEPDTLRAACEFYTRLGVHQRVAEIESRLHGVAAPAAVNDFRRQGEVWTVCYRGARATVRDAKGMRDLACLLAEPAREIAALDLAAVGRARVVEADLGETLDARARAAYKARLVELQEQLDEADAGGDDERSARAQAERDALLDQLSSAYGLRGRLRRTGSPAERARSAVTARIRDAIRRIDTQHPELGRHLTRSVRTGTFCSYDPDPPTRWEL